MKRRAIFGELCGRLRESRKFLQVLLGPRQVGKTTLALQVAEELKRPVHYVSADLAALQDLAWLRQQWEQARRMTRESDRALLIVDEVQKIPHWSEMVKELWDEDTRTGSDLSVMILGSSPWLMQKGLSESLAGRFEITPITHWSFGEMEEHFGWSLDEYIYFGGYPGAAPLAEVADVSRWMNYINDSLIETTISRDILLMTQVNKPALLRRLFHLACKYSGQVLSFQKIVGQLQDAGNTTTIAHYLELLAGASLLCGVQKFAGQPVRTRSSSPKFAVYNTSLMSAQSALSFVEARQDHTFWGRLVESAVGAHLLNGIRGTPIELTYWCEGDREVDFVLQRGDRLLPIEVKSNSDGLGQSGMDTFLKRFGPCPTLLVGDQGMPLDQFLRASVPELLS